MLPNHYIRRSGLAAPTAGWLSQNGPNSRTEIDRNTLQLSQPVKIPLVHRRCRLRRQS